MPTTLTINGQKRIVDVDPQKPLLWAIREDFGLVGTKFGCGMGLCGACTVHIDGKATRSCVTPISAAAGKAITTIEHVATQPAGMKVSEAWTQLDVPQCGYCQAGQIMSASALLEAKPAPSDAEIETAMAGNICRCACYMRIREAIKVAAGISTGVPA